MACANGFTVGNGGYDDNRRVSPMIAILPYLEQQALYENIVDVQKNYRNGSKWQGLRVAADKPSGDNSPVAANIPIPFAICPSETRPESASGYMGRNNFVFNQGDFPGRSDTYVGRSGHNTRGPFVSFAWLDLSAVTDGTSNTVAVSERGVNYARGRDILSSIAQNVKTAIDIFSEKDANGTSEIPGTFNPQNCYNLIGSQREYDSSASSVRNDRSGRRWLSGEPMFSAFNTILPPNSPTCMLGTSSSDPGIIPPTSYHSGGVNVALLDGAVTFVSETIYCGILTDSCVKSGTSPYGIWGAVGSRDGGETQGLP
jgi:prepilin-type processing-associated H-X9-DG protein